MKKNLLYAIISSLVMIVFPFFAITFVKGDASMATTFILFFIINPITSIYIGICSGKNIKNSWYNPFLLALLFVAGTWIFFSFAEIAFIFYAAVYLALGILSMLITSFIKKFRQ
jgi:hypothetical protein